MYRIRRLHRSFRRRPPITEAMKRDMEAEARANGEAAERTARALGLCVRCLGPRSDGEEVCEDCR